MPVIATETVVVLSGCDDAPARCNLEDFAVLLCDQARKRGCKACAVWADGGIKVRIQQGCAEALREIVQWLAESAAEQGATISIGEDQEAGPYIRDMADGPMAWGSVVQARLTRDLLCALPEGAFVVCNTTSGELGVGLGRLGPFASRAQQWQNARVAGLDGSMCRVFWSQADYDAFLHGASETSLQLS